MGLEKEERPGQVGESGGMTETSDGSDCDEEEAAGLLAPAENGDGDGGGDQGANDKPSPSPPPAADEAAAESAPPPPPPLPATLPPRNATSAASGDSARS